MDLICLLLHMAVDTGNNFFKALRARQSMSTREIPHLQACLKRNVDDFGVKYH